MGLDVGMVDLVMPVANMLLAAIRVGGYRRDSQPRGTTASALPDASAGMAAGPAPDPIQPCIPSTKVRNQGRGQAGWVGSREGPGHRSLSKRHHRQGGRPGGFPGPEWSCALRGEQWRSCGRGRKCWAPRLQRPALSSPGKGQGSGVPPCRAPPGDEAPNCQLSAFPGLRAWRGDGLSGWDLAGPVHTVQPAA